MPFFEFIFQSHVLIFTSSMLFALIWWVFTLLGMLDIHLFDAHIEGDADVDLAVDFSDGFDSSDALHLLGFGMVPFSILLTVFLFTFGWLGILLHRNLSDLSNVVAIPLVLIGSLLMSAGVARLLHPIFKETGKAQSAHQFIGKVAILKSGSLSAHFGQATLKNEGENLEIAVRSEHEQTTAQYGDKVLLLHYDAENNVYLAEPYHD